MLFTQTEQYDSLVSGHLGRPDNYPKIEAYPGLLFYIQRNQNINSVIYEVNLLPGNLLDLNHPIKINWINFKADGSHEIQSLNYIQQKLAYGYDFDVISHDLIAFNFVSYPQMKFYLTLDENRQYMVVTTFGEIKIRLEMIYIYAEDFGVFPQVKFAEFYGSECTVGAPFYKKLLLQ